MVEPKYPATYVTTVNPSQSAQILKDLKEKDFEISKPQYTDFSAKKKGVSCTVFQSGKLVVQGKEMAEFIEFYLEPEVLNTFAFQYDHIDIDTTPHIGIDESGKGDLFGPLCIAGVFAEGKGIHHLKEIGVRDSKKMSDGAIAKVAKLIKTDFLHHVIKINPLKYNELYDKFANLNKLLAWGHAATIEQIIQQTACRKVIIDQFGHEYLVINALKKKRMEIELTQRHRGEEDLVVAAASILARNAFVEGLKILSEQYGVELPKGASAKTILVGKTLVSKHGREVLKSVAKLHFKTIETIIES